MEGEAMFVYNGEEGGERRWQLDLVGDDLYSWKTFNGCTFVFEEPKDHSQSTYRIPRSSLRCNDQDNAIVEDLEIFGRNLTIETEVVEYKGFCGFPGQKCKDCLIGVQLFPCKVDSDCNSVGDRDWTNRNLKSYCSNETYDGDRLCKREHYTCPPDSLNSDGSEPDTGKCVVDEDCENMSSFTALAARNVSYLPHCFNGVCCARQLLCDSAADLRYALPVESNALRHPEPCRNNKDCKMFPGAVGTCHHFKQVSRVLKLREEKYLKSNERTRINAYGMCCYETVKQCDEGGTPFIPELADRTCSEDTDCNPKTRPFEWNAYCSQGVKAKTCCREKTADAMCPDGFTPYRNEPECERVDPVIPTSGTCPNSDGMCHKGHCCPRMTVNHHRLAEPHHSNYLTNAPCDPTQPLDITYLWAYCDEKEEKVMVMGNRNWRGDELDWLKTRCNVKSDCGHLKYLCVHKLYGLRYCVVDPLYKLESIETNLWNLCIVIISIFIGIIVVIVWTPSPVFK